jgi:hypothetical protein
MSETHDSSSGAPEPVSPEKASAKKPDSDPAIEVSESPDELRQGTVDFNTYTKPVLGESGVRRQGSMSEPISGGSIVSWAELLSKHPRSDDEVALGSLPELQIDSISDNAIIKSLERETKKSGITRLPERRTRSDSAEKIKKPTPAPTPPAADQKAPSEDTIDIQDWFRSLTDDTGSSVDLNNAAQQARDSLKDSGGKRPDESDVLAAALEYDDGTSRVDLGREPLPSMGLSEAVPAPEVSPARPALPPRAIRPQTRPGFTIRKLNNLNAWIGGAAIGVAGSAVVWTGLWISGALGTSKKPAENAPPAPQKVEVATSKPTPEMARQHLENGEPDLALSAFEQCEESRAVLAGRGQARWLVYLRHQKQRNAAPAELDPEVGLARQDLVAARSAEATLWLGLINEALGHYDLARETYEHGLANFPDRARLFNAARTRLDALANPGIKVSAVVDPQLGLALALTMIELPAEAGGFNAADEAGFDFWEAVSLARKGDFTASRTALLKARAAHEQRRDLIAHRGLNPESDPREDIFLHSCDQMLSWWDVQAKLHYAGFKIGDRTPAQAIDALLSAQQKYDAAMKSLTTALKIDRPEDAPATVEILVKQRQQAEENWKKARDAAQNYDANLAKKDAELVALQKSTSDELKRATAKEAAARKALDEVAAARKVAEESYQSVQSRLRKARLVGDEPSPAEVVQALDTLISASPDTKNTELGRLRSLLEKSRTPEQMLELWPVLLHADAPRELAAPALADAEMAAKDPQASDRLKAHAAAVRGLALIVREEYAEARTALAVASKDADLMKESIWSSRVKQANTLLADSSAMAAHIGQALERGDTSRALDLANRGLRIFPADGFARDHARMLAFRGEAFVRCNKLDEAQNDAAAAVDGGALADGCLTRGHVAEKRGQWATARRDYQASLDATSNPQDQKRIRLALARVLAGPDARSSDLEQAAKLAEEAIAAGQPEGHLVKARVFYRMRKAPEAVEQALLALKGIAPREYDEDWLALVHNSKVASAEVASKPDPERAEKFFTQGLQLYYSRQYAAAEEQLEIAARINDQDARILYFLGLSRLPLGKIDSAHEEFRRAAALERQGLPDAATISTLFERIQGPERQLINRYRQ